MDEKKGFYCLDREYAYDDFLSNAGMFYVKSGNDMGLTFKKAVSYANDSKGNFVVVNSDGEVVFDPLKVQ